MSLTTDQISKYFDKVNFSNFYYVGTFPSNKYPNINLEKLLNTDPPLRLAMVFNTREDTHPGEHWVAVFIDPGKPSIEFYDPTGDLPMGHNKKFLQMLEKKNMKLPKKKRFQFKINNQRHQDLLIEIGNKMAIDDFCGVYAIIFILRRLKGETFKSATMYEPGDKKIIKFNDHINV